LLLLAASFSLRHTTATTVIYTLSLHDALPILAQAKLVAGIVHQGNTLGATAHIPSHFFIPQVILGAGGGIRALGVNHHLLVEWVDRKSTRLNSSHVSISYAVFCLKKKKKQRTR